MVHDICLRRYEFMVWGDKFAQQPFYRIFMQVAFTSCSTFAVLNQKLELSVMTQSDSKGIQVFGKDINRSKINLASLEKSKNPCVMTHSSGGSYVQIR